MTRLSFIAWGVPILVVSINIILHYAEFDNYERLENLEWCWLKNGALYSTLIAPFCVIWLGNTVFFGIIVTRLFYTKYTQQFKSRQLERKEHKLQKFSRRESLASVFARAGARNRKFDQNNNTTTAEITDSGCSCSSTKSCKKSCNYKNSAKNRLRSSKLKDRNRSDIIRRLKGLIGLNFLLGTSWGIAFFAFSETSVVAIWIFVVVNSTQGVWVFVFYCLLREEVLEFYKDIFYPKYFRKPRRLSVVTSNTLETRTIDRNIGVKIDNNFNNNSDKSTDMQKHISKDSKVSVDFNKPTLRQHKSIVKPSAGKVDTKDSGVETSVSSDAMSIEKDSTELGGGGLFQGIFRFLKRNSRKNSFTQQKVNHELDSTLYDLKRKRRSNLASGTENQKA